MKTSVRNNYEGTIMSVRHGMVNDEVEILLNGCDMRITSIVSSTSSKSMGLATGKQVVAIIDEELVILVSDHCGVKFASNNNFQGTVLTIKESGVVTEVNLLLKGGKPITAIVATEAVRDMDIKTGDTVTALIKATMVFLGIKE
ncbi:MAG: TOBE domain-containing protein [Synergistaceae bacterium]|nr:TOBE domain-containing protein [Synergistaceae bacterium]